MTNFCKLNYKFLKIRFDRKDNSEIEKKQLFFTSFINLYLNLKNEKKYVKIVNASIIF